MAVLKTLIGHRLENLKAKYVAFLAFLVLTILLVVYSVMLLLQDISILGKSLGQPLPSYIYSSLGSSLSSSPPDIEIVYPNSEQTANTESDLEISGISNYDPRNTCHVSVIINDVKPYRKTIPTTGDMKTDYSTWKYVIESDSSNTLKQGDNKITARLLCAGENGEDIRKWDSVAVIGQSGNERDNGSLDRETLTLTLEDGSTPGISSPTIEIDRSTLIELINKRIGDSSEDIKNSIRDYTLAVYIG